MQHIFSSIRRCSCFITLETEPRNVIINLYVGYHCEQENKLFSASVIISLTKIVGWVHFYLHALRHNQLLFQSKKEHHLSRKKIKMKIIKINFCLYLEFEGEKGILQVEQSFLPSYFMSQGQLGLISKSPTHMLISPELYVGGKRLFVRKKERTPTCVRKLALLETCWLLLSSKKKQGP